MKYRKKPIIIEAIQWNGKNKKEIKSFCGDYATFVSVETFEYNEVVLEIMKYNELITQSKLIIKTLEGELVAMQGDYIVKGIKGEFYPCKPDIFEQTYEKYE